MTAIRACLDCGGEATGPRCPAHTQARRAARGGRNGSTRSWRNLRQEVLERDGFTCRYCGARATTVDHVVAVARGGTDSPENCVAACSPCNLAKGATTAIANKGH